QKMLDSLFAAEIGSGGLTSLVKYSLRHPTCSAHMKSSRMMALGYRDPTFRQSAEYVQYESLYNKVKDARVVSLERGNDASVIDYLENLYTHRGNLVKQLGRQAQVEGGNSPAACFDDYFRGITPGNRTA